MWFDFSNLHWTRPECLMGEFRFVGRESFPAHDNIIDRLGIDYSKGSKLVEDYHV